MGYAGKVRQGLILNRTFDGKSNALPRHRLGSADIYTLARQKLRLLRHKLMSTLNPLESYIQVPGAVWAAIFHTGKPFISTILKRCDN